MQTAPRPASAPEAPSDVRIGPLMEGHANWLANRREDDEWLIIDTRRSDKRARRVSFRYLLPDGSLLTDPENAHLYRTVKEFGVLLREGPDAVSDDLVPSLHGTLLMSIMHLVGWMRLNGIHAFAALTRGDVDRLCEEAVYGSAALLRAPERLRSTVLRLLDGGYLDTVVAGSSRRTIDRALVYAQAAIPLTVRAPQLTAILRAVEDGLRDGRTTRSIAMSLAEPSSHDKTLLTYEALRRNLSPLDYLWIFRLHVRGDNIGFDPYPGGLTNLARELGAEIQRTPSVPPRQAMELVDHSIRWIMDYAEPILIAYERAISLRNVEGADAAQAVSTAVGEMADCVNKPGAPWPLLPVVRKDDQEQDGVTLPAAVRYLVLACFIVIATFTGRRLDEILDLKVGCTRGNAKYGYWIRTYIEKTLRNVDETPCPGIVVFAVERVLERLNRQASAMGLECSLSTWISIDVNGRQTLRRLNPSKDLDSFAALVSISRLSDGSSWHFTPHQFRRFFAIVYIWRYQYGDLGALAHHLRHFNLRMTQRYVTEAVAGLVIEEEKALTRTVFVEAARGERRLGGAAGSRFRRLFERAKTEIAKHVRIVLPNRLEQYVERFVEKSQILLKNNPWSYCMCPMTIEGACRANCRSEATASEGARGPDLAGAKPEACAGCVFNLTDMRFRPVIEREIADTGKRLAGKFLPAPARMAEERRLRLLESYLLDFPLGPEGA